MPELPDPVRVSSPCDGVALVQMCDEASKNTFTDELIAGVEDALARASADDAVRAVVLTGFGTYFCCGGTREGLAQLHEGTATFVDAGDEPSAADAVDGVFSAPLRCRVPVVAAMQGHAIGGGLALGLFCDLTVWSRESVYTANFMTYGFTPGFGSTLILPHRLGPELAAEMLYTAETFRGAELAERGLRARVLPRGQVLPAAIELARLIADKPLRAVVELKARLTADLRSVLPDVVSAELSMHAATIHEPEVAERLRTRY